ncbi:MAG: c-type cytochrome biogenesis protein CcsB [Streptosporangiales bacterium]|nr:c-type cytochrome biogenesis protein CcsB [Streptosporangiales bacterium]
MIIAILVYAVALLAFTIELGYGRRRRTVAEAAEEAAPEFAGVAAAGRTTAAAGESATSAVAGAGAVTETGAAATGAPGASAASGRHGPADDAAGATHRAGAVGLAATVLGFLVHGGMVATRGLAVDRWPWGNMYEFVAAITLGAVGTFLVVAFRYRARYLGAFVLIPVLLALAINVRYLYVDAGPLVPALHSYWIAIHVTAAIIATGAFTVSGASTVMYLMADRAERKRAAGEAVKGVLGRLPGAALLDRLAHRTVVFGFPLWTFAVIAGAIWADEAWGRYWGWDPKEVWSFITWVVYAGYLHSRATAGWRGRKAAIVSLIGFACLLFNFFAVNILFSGLHSYGGV